MKKDEPDFQGHAEIPDAVVEALRDRLDNHGRTIREHSRDLEEVERRLALIEEAKPELLAYQVNELRTKDVPRIEEAVKTVRNTVISVGVAIVCAAGVATLVNYFTS